MIQENIYTGSIHGHSPACDGASGVEQIVKAGVERRINVIGTSSHSTVGDSFELVRQVQIRRDSGAEIIATIGAEIKTSCGDLLVAKPAEDWNEAFADQLEWLADWNKRLQPVEIAKRTIGDHGALLVIVHPGLPLTDAFSFEEVSDFAVQLNDEERKHVGLETRNWFSNLQPVIKRVVERRADKLASELDLAQLGGDDYHASWMIGKQTFSFEAKELSPNAFTDAFKDRKIWPSDSERLTILTWLKLARQWTNSKSRYNLNPRFSLDVNP